MKSLFTLAAMTLSLVCFAQTDSTEIKLQKYKDLYDKELITEQEYDLLKKKELDISSVNTKKDTISVQSLKSKYKSQFIAGSIVFGAGIGLIGLGVYLKDKIVIYSNSQGQKEVRDYKAQSKVSFICGALSTGVGVFIITKGIINKQKYLERISLSPTSASITFKF